MRTVQSWTCELGYGADTMFHRTYFLFVNNFVDKDKILIHPSALQGLKSEDQVLGDEQSIANDGVL